MVDYGLSRKGGFIVPLREEVGTAGVTKSEIKRSRSVSAAVPKYSQNLNKKDFQINLLPRFVFLALVITIKGRETENSVTRRKTVLSPTKFQLRNFCACRPVLCQCDYALHPFPLLRLPTQ